MKGIFAILFLTVYLGATTQLFQLLKFPVLVEHFIEHKAINAKMSILDFLVLHYNNHPADSDYDQDQRLPFIAHSDVLSFCFVHTPFSPFEIKTKVSVNHQTKKLALEDLFSKNTYLSAIWQPPKAC